MGLLVVRKLVRSAGRRYFSVPRVNVLVREQTGFHFAVGFIHKSAFTDAAIVGLVVLQAKVRHVIAQAE